ncbi:hypothetical protein SAMN04490188_4882 [Pseudomonas kilonensis]|uniref:Uncharacterized protein n=1 Tax=Pseudomonas kilonensis TaxID=132476 RepID=A0ABY0ZGL2_9PSED|nr:hypothetical protein SAMN04490188_4882 [Pseudomonas kilonensis]
MLFLSVDPLTLLTNLSVNIFAVFTDNWLSGGSIEVKWMFVSPAVDRRPPGFNEPLDVRYGSQKEIFLGLLGGRLIVSRASCGIARSDP